MGADSALIVSISALLIGLGVAVAAAVYYARLLQRERKRGQGELLEQSKFAAAVFDSLPIGLAIRDLDGRYLFVNKAWETFTGARRQDVIGKTVHDRAPKAEADAVVSEDRKVLERGPNYQAPMQDFVFRNRHFMLSRTVLTNAEGKPRGIMVASIDATERLQMEQAVKDQIALTVAILDQMPNAVFVKDAEGHYTMVNRAWTEMNGVPPEKAIGKTVFDIYPERLAAQFTDEDERLLRQGVNAGPLENIRHGPRAGQWRIVRKGVLRRPDGSVRGIISSSTDISEMKRIEAENADRAKFISEVIDSLPISIGMRDTEGRYLIVNKMWERYFGVKREDVIGRRRRDLPGATGDEVRRTDAERIEKLDRELLARGPDYLPEPRQLERQGRNYIINSRALADAGGKLIGILSAGIDNTEQRAMQKQLEFEQRRFEIVVRAARVGIVDWDGRTHATFYSPRFREILGYPPDADTSGWPDYFKVMIHPDDRERVTTRWRDFIFGRGPEGQSGEFYAPEEYRLLRRDGSYVWVQVSGIAVRDEKGFVTRWIAATTDITERRAQEEALRASVRLREEVERMSRHDLKTPLNSVIAMSRLLREGGKLTPEDAELLGTIERAGFRILSMINLSLDLFRMESGTYQFRPQPIDVAQVARKVIGDLESQAASKGIVFDLRPKSGIVARGEELLCYSMLANLVKNAVEAAPEGSAVRISLSNKDDVVEIQVHNRGVVVDSMRQRFFQKYATAGKPGGLGLGTYSARLMARVQQGEIALDTTDPDGTTLVVRLRAAGEAEAARTQKREGGVAAALATARDALPPLRVLVVDDDEFNRLVLRRTLPVPPLALAMAVNGRAALDEAEREWPDVVLLDLEMPVMDGYQTARALRAREGTRGDGKRLVIVAISSNDEQHIVDKALAAGCDHYLTKPAPRDALWKVLKNIPVDPRAEQDAPASGVADAVLLDPDLEDVLPVFLHTRREMLDEMPKALDAGDRVAFRRLAHKLAGSFALYGFAWASAQCRALARDAAGGEAGALRSRTAAVLAHLDQVPMRFKAAAGEAE